MKIRYLTVIAAISVLTATFGCSNRLAELQGKAFNPKNSAEVTAAFSKLREGMTEKQVAAILGKPAHINLYKVTNRMTVPVKIKTKSNTLVWYYPGSGTITFKVDAHSRLYSVVTIFRESDAIPLKK